MSYSIVAAVQEKVYRTFLPSVAQRAYSPRRRSQAQAIITDSGAPKGRSVAPIAYIRAELPRQLTPLPWAAPEVALELGGEFYRHVPQLPVPRGFGRLPFQTLAMPLEHCRASHLVVPRSHWQWHCGTAVEV